MRFNEFRYEIYTVKYQLCKCCVSIILTNLSERRMVFQSTLDLACISNSFFQHVHFHIFAFEYQLLVEKNMNRKVWQVPRTIQHFWSKWDSQQCVCLLYSFLSWGVGEFLGHASEPISIWKICASLFFPPFHNTACVCRGNLPVAM